MTEPSRPAASLFGRHRPDDVVAFSLAGGTRTPLSAEALARRVLAVEAALRSHPAHAPGASVVLLAEDRALFAAGLLGAWAAELVVGLPPNAGEELIRALRSRPGTLTVLHDGESDRGVDLGALPLPEASPRECADLAARLAALVEARPGDPLAERALVDVFTSGSTGEARAYRKRARQLLGEAELLGELFPGLRGARVLSAVPAHHVYGLLFGVLAPLLGGGAFARDSVQGAEAFAHALRVAEPGVVVSVPAHLRALAHLPPAELAPIRSVFSSGAPLPAQTATRLAQGVGWEVHEILGSTETGGFAWRKHDATGAGRYRPFPVVSVHADADTLLVLRSPFVDEHAADFVTADRVRLEDDGTFTHLGRADGVVKIGGTRVSVLEVEERLRALPEVEEVAVIAEEVGGSRGWALWAVVVAPSLARDPRAASRRLRAALREWLPAAAIPRRYRFVSTLPRSETGKLPRAALRALFEEPS